MPNWCYTQACFTGEPYNIYKLKKDIDEAMMWRATNKYYCNFRYFFNINGFNIDLYKRQYDYDLLTRGYFINASLSFEYPGNMVKPRLYVTMDTAWDMDYRVLQLISIIYDVKFSAYSEEPMMGVYTKCRNSNDDNYDYDFTINVYSDSDEVIEKMDDLELDYYTPFKNGNPESERLIKTLKENGIQYRIENVEGYQCPLISGIYYDEK